MRAGLFFYVIFTLQLCALAQSVTLKLYLRKDTNMTYSRDKNLNSFICELIKAGWHFISKNKHGKIASPAGKRFTFPISPSDHRAFLNFKSTINQYLRSIS